MAGARGALLPCEGEESRMTAGMEFAPTPAMALHTSPALVAFASLLQLPALDLEARVALELTENPALEEDPAPVSCPLCGAPAAGSATGSFPCPCPCLAGGARSGARPGAGAVPDPGRTARGGTGGSSRRSPGRSSAGTSPALIGPVPTCRRAMRPTSWRNSRMLPG
ncbi:hypothetical protein [Streptomyces gardneri]|uniref:hypothetical protein n=1 Tax=Streptomyces gardneri TaxID=66892 RepID=UPI003405DFB3